MSENSIDYDTISDYFQKKLERDLFNVSYEQYLKIEEYIADYLSFFEKSVLKKFSLRNMSKINEFILENDDLIVLLRYVEPIVRKYFKKESLVLEYVPDPEIDLNQLVLYIQTQISEDNIDEVDNKLHEIDKEVFHRLNNDTRNKFLIDVE